MNVCGKAEQMWQLQRKERRGKEEGREENGEKTEDEETAKGRDDGVREKAGEDEKK